MCSSDLNGISGSFDIFEVEFAVAANKLGPTDVILDVGMTSFQGGQFDSVIGNGTVTTEFMKWYSKFDVNKDDVIDLNDITFALQYLLVTEFDAEWAVAYVADVNDDGVISAADLSLILANYTVPYYG